MSNGYIAAVYDFRSKQAYIYNTNRVKEIIGASEIIKDALQNVIKDPENKCNVKHDKKGQTFSLSDFTGDDEIEGAVLYEGGGNTVILFKNETAFKKFNNHLSKWVIENAPGLSPVCGMAEFDDIGGQRFSNVARSMFADLDKSKRLSPHIYYDNVLPFTLVDRQTSLPITFRTDDSFYKESKRSGVSGKIELSAESKSKIDAFRDIGKYKSYPKYEKHFDNMIEEKGRESLLAVIYIDGNNMGRRVKEFIPDDVLFEEGVNLQRELTISINEAFVETPLAEIAKIVGSEDDLISMRRIIGG